MLSDDCFVVVEVNSLNGFGNHILIVGLENVGKEGIVCIVKEGIVVKVVLLKKQHAWAPVLGYFMSQHFPGQL